MQRESSPSRRQFLGAAAGTVATVATAGCLGSLVGASSTNRIEPEEPSEPRKGSPGEFYYFLEENGIEVTELLEEDDKLYLTYRSEAETVEESDEEIMIVFQVYRQALIHRGSSIEFLYTEIANPFDGQAHGWGINSTWIHELDGEMQEDGTSAEDPDDVDAENESMDSDANANDTTGDEVDMAEVMLWSNIMNSKVYGDGGDGGSDTGLENGRDDGTELEDGGDDGTESEDGGDNGTEPDES
ncbi:twin-arginine translocation signal domain-containing protein [Haloterrigena alkaliphila]|uniref:Twin-arginine translocation signal domain-containing protein n=1 Tax=Haloterrigena alkaliphila TaxID=2816475 RepID=A0A8A2VI04_9EURY|nr:twin-arginine translocation signal domain-containing protein [Haloterrigena alkaliphila]QSX00288.1 twin-arginine translocation signal domain-containing protein [Haloterrigena alkaliphila]